MGGGGRGRDLVDELGVVVGAVAAPAHAALHGRARLDVALVARDGALGLHGAALDLVALRNDTLGNKTISEGHEAEAAPVARELVAHDHGIVDRTVRAEVLLHNRTRTCVSTPLCTARSARPPGLAGVWGSP